jgi:hypothetical protein
LDELKEEIRGERTWGWRVEAVAATAFLPLLLLLQPLSGSKRVLHLLNYFDLLFCLMLRHVPKNLPFYLVRLIIVPYLFYGGSSSPSNSLLYSMAAGTGTTEQHF